MQNEESLAANSDHKENSVPCANKIISDSNIDELDSTTSEVVNHYASDNICSLYSDFLKSGISEEALKQALSYYIKNKSDLKNSRYISIADYSLRSNKKRYYLLDTLSGKVEKFHVSHGSGKINNHSYGDPDHDGRIDSCKLSDSELNKVNTERSKVGKSATHNRFAMTRPGFYKTTYLANSTAHDPEVRSSGAWPMISTEPRINKLIMKGLVKEVNDDALVNGVVMHEAWYNTGSIMGRSFGCPAFRPNEGRIIMNKIKGGSLFYAFVPKCEDDMNIVKEKVSDWKNTCN